MAEPMITDQDDHMINGDDPDDQIADPRDTRRSRDNKIVNKCIRSHIQLLTSSDCG